MTFAGEDRVIAVLRDIHPRPGFEGELLASLLRDTGRLRALSPEAHGHRSRWVVAGALAGVVSATGAVYWTARRRHRDIA